MLRQCPADHWCLWAVLERRRRAWAPSSAASARTRYAVLLLVSLLCSVRCPPSVPSRAALPSMSVLAAVLTPCCRCCCCCRLQVRISPHVIITMWALEHMEVRPLLCVALLPRLLFRLLFRLACFCTPCSLTRVVRSYSCSCVGVLQAERLLSAAAVRGYVSLDSFGQQLRLLFACLKLLTTLSTCMGERQRGKHRAVVCNTATTRTRAPAALREPPADQPISVCQTERLERKKGASGCSIR